MIQFKSVSKRSGEEKLSLCASLMLLCVCLVCLSKTVYAQAPTAGVAEPERQKPLLPTVNDQPLFEIPSNAQRSLDEQSEVSIPVGSFLISYDHPQFVTEHNKQAVLDHASSYLSVSDSQFNFLQLDDIANAITDKLRLQGLLLAKAILPPQEVEDGTIHFRVLVGVLEAVEAKDNLLYSSKSLSQIFERQIGASVQRDRVESALLRINDMPGINAVGLFRPGSEIGETNISIKAVNESAISGYARLDNYGVESVGDFRLLAGMAVNNITQHTDRLTIDAVKTFHPGDLRNARIGYEITEKNLIHTFGFGFSETRYDVEASAIKIEGDTEIGELYVKSSWLRQQRYNFSTQLALNAKRAEQSVIGNVQGVDRLTVLTAGIITDAVDTRFRGLHRATLMWHQGFEGFIGAMDKRGNNNSLTQFNNQKQLSADFEKISASYTRLQAISANHSLLLRLSGQYTEDPLSSLEKMSLAGPYAVRAYPVGELSSDTASFASLAWQINGGVFSREIAYGENSWSDILTVSLFFDWAEGKVLNGAGNISRDRLQGVGAEIKMIFPERSAYLQMSLAEPTAHYNNLDQKNTQYWVAVGFEF